MLVGEQSRYVLVPHPKAGADQEIVVGEEAVEAGEKMLAEA